MKLSLVKVAFALLFSVPTILSPAKAGEYGYWNNGYWCDHTNQYCETQTDPNHYRHNHQDYYGEYYSPEPSYYPYNNKSLFGIDVNLCISILGINTCN